MKKALSLIVCVLAVCMATPSFAVEYKVSGMFRTRMIAADLSAAKGQHTDTLADQRGRLSLQAKLDEYLTVAYHGEVDFQYGDAGFAVGRNEGGGIAGDSVNLETKNLYAKLTLPETPYSAILGLQGVRDNWSFAFALTDVAGVTVNIDTSPVKIKLGRYNLLEGDENGNTAPGFSDTNDDVILYLVQTAYAPSEKLKLNIDGYHVKNKGTLQHPNLSLLGTEEDLYYLGANVVYAFPAAKVNAWAFYNFGTSDNAAADGGDLDTSAFAASVKANFKLGSVLTGIRGIYFSGDDDATDGDRNGVRIPWANNRPAEGFPVDEAVPFFDSDLMIMLPDMYGTTYHNGSGFAMTQAYNEFGLTGVTVNASYSPASLPNLYVRGAAGYFSVLEDSRKGATPKEGKNVGTEVCTRIGYKLGKHADLSVNAAYAMLGDFFDQPAGEDANDPYEVYTMLNVRF